jgi:hypothetical protein
LAAAPEATSASAQKEENKQGRILTQAEVSDIFRISHSSISNLEHIQIIPCARLSLRDDERSFVHDIGN